MVWKHNTVSGSDGKARCGWASADPIYQKYHDTEWGRPLKDDRALFELLTLEGCQAGLSWITVLRKREHYRKVYDGFDPKKIARYTPAKLKKPEELTVQQLAQRFGVSPGVVYYWIEHGIVRARRLNKTMPYWITLDASEEQKLRAWVHNSSRISSVS